MSKMFTVVIPVYHSKRLKRALDSIETQENKDDIEVIIVADDGNKDTYQNILKGYSFEYSIIVNEINLGPGMARQVGLDAAQGEWITFLDHDDEFALNCFTIVKERILQDKPSLLVTSNILVANDYNWPVSQAYAVNEGLGTLHGKFYNVAMLRHYNIQFSKELKTQEDTYFISLLEAHIFLDRNNLGDNFEIFVPNITYYWYLWPDSTSHKTDNKEQITFAYLERYFNDYIDACYKSVLTVHNQYPNDKDYLTIKFASILFFCYWFMEFFYHLNEETDEAGRHTELIKKNVQYVRELRESAIILLGYRNKYQIFDMLKQYPDLYGKISRALISLNFQEDIIPIHDLKTFYTQII